MRKVYTVYVLRSLTKEIRYVGFTVNINRRLKEHNSGRSKFTSRYMPWEIIKTEEFGTYAEARKREVYLKTSSGRRELKKYFLSITKL